MSFLMYLEVAARRGVGWRNDGQSTVEELGVYETYLRRSSLPRVSGHHEHLKTLWYLEVGKLSDFGVATLGTG